MSLTSKLPRLRSWLETETTFDVEYMRSLIQQWNAETASVPPIGAQGSDPLLVGMAMLYAARIEATKGDWGALYDTVGGAQWAHMTRYDYFAKHPKYGLEDMDQDDLPIVLALYDKQARSGGHVDRGSVTADTQMDVYLLSQWMPNALQNIKGTLNIHPIFRKGSQAVGGADGGFIIDGTLYQTRTTRNGMSEDWFVQSILYALLDVTNEYNIVSAAIIMPRQKVTRYIELPSLFGGTPLANVRAKFARFLGVEAK